MGALVDKYVNVAEFNSDVDTNVELKNGDWLDVSVSGTIWAGVWFTGRNGPNGWTNYSAGPDSPLPGSPPFAMLGKTAGDGYFWIGTGIRRTYQNASLGPGATRLFLRINDDSPGNGSGVFQVRLQVWR